MSELTRREAMQMGSIAAAAGMLPMAAAAADPEMALPEDPAEAFRMKIKALGSLADEEVFRLSTGHWYGFTPGKPVFPLCNIENYSVSRWQRLADGNYQFTLWEIGVHTDRATGEPIRRYLNPVTQREVEVIPYVVGPLKATITPEGVLTPGPERTVQPQNLHPRVFDGYVWYPFESPVTLPNPLPMAEYPEASTGATYSYHTIVVFAAALRDLADPDSNWAPALSYYGEFLDWPPWLEMGQIPGGMLSRGYGKKFGPESKLPADIRRKLEARVPEIFDRDNWPTMRNEFRDYLRYKQSLRDAE